MSGVVICCHLFGDVPSPPLAGLIQDKVHNWHVSMGAMSALFLLAALLFAWASLEARTAPDYRKVGAATAEAAAGAATTDAAAAASGPGDDESEDELEGAASDRGEAGGLLAKGARGRVAGGSLTGSRA